MTWSFRLRKRWCVTQLNCNHTLFVKFFNLINSVNSSTRVISPLNRGVVQFIVMALFLRRKSFKQISPYSQKGSWQKSKIDFKIPVSCTNFVDDMCYENKKFNCKLSPLYTIRKMYSNKLMTKFISSVLFNYSAKQ